MKVWTNNKFHGHWPVGTAAVVVADSQSQAASLLSEELRKRGLSQVVFESEFEEVPTNGNAVVVLCDGDY